MAQVDGKVQRATTAVGVTRRLDVDTGQLALSDGKEQRVRLLGRDTQCM